MQSWSKLILKGFLRLSTTKGAFPTSCEQHGRQMIDVHISTGTTRKTFFIHKSLLCSASPYYSKRLEGNFSDSQQNEMQLEDECPMAFHVLYQYLYSGQVLHANFFTQSRIPDDVLWLRTYKLAHHTQIDSLLIKSYENIRQVFRVDFRAVPSTMFISELYDADDCQEELRLYIVAHAAFWIYNYIYGDWRDWDVLLELQPTFGTAVARQLNKIHTNDYEGCREHPTDDKAFNTDVLLAAFIEKVIDPAERTTSAAQWVLEKSGD